jgi:hypothetical protein
MARRASIWRQNETANTDLETRAYWFRVRELRSIDERVGSRKTAKEKGGREAQTTSKEQGKGESLKLPLAPSLPGALNPLLRLLGRKPIPCEPTTGSMRQHEGEALRISQPASVIAERLFVQIPEEME